MKKIQTLFLGALLFASSIAIIPRPAYAVCQSNGDIPREVATIFKVQFCSLDVLLAKIAEYLVGFAGFVAVIFIIIGGYQYMMAGRSGNEKAAESARNTLSSAVIGLVIVIFAYTIIRVLVQAISDVNK